MTPKEEVSLKMIHRPIMVVSSSVVLPEYA